MNLARLPSRAQRVAEDRRLLARLHDAQIDLLVVEASILLLVRRGRAHEDGAGNPPGSRSIGSDWGPTDRFCRGSTPGRRHRQR